MKAIAERFGVNASTVSRALSGDSRISEAMREGIRSYADSIDYSPDVFRRKRRNAIGLLMFSSSAGRFDDHYQSDIVRDASSALFEHGCHAHVEYLPREASAWPAFLKEGRVDGLLVAGHPPKEVCQRIRERRLPAVIFSDSLERTGCFCVRPDPSIGTIQAVKRLLELGHKRIGFVATSREYMTVEERYKAFCFALLDGGIQPDASLMVFDQAPSVDGGRAGVRRLLGQGAAPSAIVFINDYMALGGMMELLSRGFKLPEDVSIAGHDNGDICEELEPSLSSVDMAFGALIGEALQLLKAQLDDGFDTPVERVLKASFVERRSVAPAKGMKSYVK